MPDLVGVSPMQNKEPKRYKVPSNDYGITASDAADTLIRAEEIKGNKELHNAASKYISGKLIAIREAKLQAAKNASKANAS